MKKIAMMICGEVSKKCTSNGCFRAFNDKIEGFSMYSEEDVLISAINTCSGCNEEPLENLKVKIEKMKKAEIDVVHLSTCIRGRCELYGDFARELSLYFDVRGYTHGSKDGKKGNTINIIRSEV
ncbi:MAG: CGGC domain-containing protein [Firmicutes bacterium]|nr:CGGC domain-containing protein [Bacillota bacterium]